MAQTGQEEHLLEFGIIGTDREGSYSSTVARGAVQRLLLSVAEEPRPRRFLEDALRDTGIDTLTLERLGLVRLEGDRYVITFCFFTRADVARVRAVAEQASGSLAGALLAGGYELETLLKSHPGPDWRALAYILLGCFSLDWDGLTVAAELGYSTSPHLTIGEDKFIPWAAEKSDLTLQGIYWGSHNAYLGDVALTTFGDHFSLPRHGLPDLAWRWRLPRQLGSSAPPQLKTAVEGAAGYMVDAFLRQVGRVLLSLRQGDKAIPDLTRLLGIEREDAERLVAFLRELGYVGQHGEVLRAEIPVLSQGDAAMVRQVRRVGREAMEDWLTWGYDRVKGELSALTPMRYGVPFPDLFPQIWHYLFGITNRRLVEADFFADPYSPARRYQGFIPAVWHQSLQHSR